MARDYEKYDSPDGGMSFEEKTAAGAAGAGAVYAGSKASQLALGSALKDLARIEGLIAQMDADIAAATTPTAEADLESKKADLVAEKKGVEKSIERNPITKKQAKATAKEDRIKANMEQAKTAKSKAKIGRTKTAKISPKALGAYLGLSAAGQMYGDDLAEAGSGLRNSSGGQNEEGNYATDLDFVLDKIGAGAEIAGISPGTVSGATAGGMAAKYGMDKVKDIYNTDPYGDVGTKKKMGYKDSFAQLGKDAYGAVADRAERVGAKVKAGKDYVSPWVKKDPDRAAAKKKEMDDRLARNKDARWSDPNKGAFEAHNAAVDTQEALRAAETANKSGKYTARSKHIQGIINKKIAHLENSLKNIDLSSAENMAGDKDINNANKGLKKSYENKIKQLSSDLELAKKLDDVDLDNPKHKLRRRYFKDNASWIEKFSNVDDALITARQGVDDVVAKGGQVVDDVVNRGGQVAGAAAEEGKGLLASAKERVLNAKRGLFGQSQSPIAGEGGGAVGKSEAPAGEPKPKRSMTRKLMNNPVTRFGAKASMPGLVDMALNTTANMMDTRGGGEGMTAGEVGGQIKDAALGYADERMQQYDDQGFGETAMTVAEDAGRGFVNAARDAIPGIMQGAHNIYANADPFGPDRSRAIEYKGATNDDLDNFGRWNPFNYGYDENSVREQITDRGGMDIEAIRRAAAAGDPTAVAQMAEINQQTEQQYVKPKPPGVEGDPVYDQKPAPGAEGAAGDPSQQTADGQNITPQMLNDPNAMAEQYDSTYLGMYGNTPIFQGVGANGEAQFSDTASGSYGAQGFNDRGALDQRMRAQQIQAQRAQQQQQGPDLTGLTYDQAARVMQNHQSMQLEREKMYNDAQPKPTTAKDRAMMTPEQQTTVLDLEGGNSAVPTAAEMANNRQRLAQKYANPSMFFGGDGNAPIGPIDSLLWNSDHGAAMRDGGNAIKYDNGSISFDGSTVGMRLDPEDQKLAARAGYSGTFK